MRETTTNKYILKAVDRSTRIEYEGLKKHHDGHEIAEIQRFLKHGTLWTRRVRTTTAPSRRNSNRGTRKLDYLNITICATDRLLFCGGRSKSKRDVGDKRQLT